jgi:hypothetical protein
VSRDNQFVTSILVEQLDDFVVNLFPETLRHERDGRVRFTTQEFSRLTVKVNHHFTMSVRATNCQGNRFARAIQREQSDAAESGHPRRQRPRQSSLPHGYQSRRPLTATQIQSYTMSHVKPGRLDSIVPVRGHGELDVVASFFDGKLIISFGLGKGLLCP